MGTAKSPRLTLDQEPSQSGAARGRSRNGKGLAARARLAAVVGGAAIALACSRPDRPSFPVLPVAEGPAIPQLKVLEDRGSLLLVSYERNGVKLFAEVYRPRDHAPRPAVIVIPGGFDGPNRNNRDLCREFARRGYLAALPHLRGTGRSEGEITFCLEEGEDVRALARALSQVGGSGPYCYVGVSFGAAIALQAGRDDPDLRGIAHVFGPTDFVQQLRMLENWGAHDKVAKWHTWIGGSPEEKPEEYERRDPLEFAKSVRAPLLILQAEKDVLVPSRQAARLVWAREQAGRTVHKAALGPNGEPWDKPLVGPAKVLEPLTGRGPASDDNLLFFAELPHATNRTVLQEVHNAVEAWLTG